MKKLALACLTVGFFITGPVLAEDAPEDGPKIKGGVQMNVEAGQDVSAAIGNEAEAEQELGAIDSGEISGDIEDTVVADEDVSAAIGNKSTAKQKVGTIGGQ